MYYFIHHFFGKSTEELINKILRGDAKFNKTSMKLNKIKRYFKQNKRNKAKIELIEKKLGFNLSKYKK